VLVTGPTGNVGRPLVGALLAAGCAVRALATRPDEARRTLVAGAAPDEAARLTAVRFDFADPGTWAAAFAGGEALFLLRPPAVSDAARVINPAVDAAVAAGVRRVAFLSVQGAARNPVVPHHAVERHLERLAAARPDGTPAAVAYTFLRAAFFMQNLSTTHAADIRALGEVLVPAGRGRTAFVDARDVAAAAARVLAAPAADTTHRDRAYELTGREAPTYDEVAATLTRVLGRPIVYRHPGALRFYRHMRRRGLSRAHVAVMVALYTTARLGLAAHLSPELEQLLGRAPVDFERFARDSADVWR
jgi:uncharacterized protein YbjT (DUF2867 family)